MIAFLMQTEVINWTAVTAVCALFGLVCAGMAVYVRYVVRDEIRALDERYLLRREWVLHQQERAAGEG